MRNAEKDIMLAKLADEHVHDIITIEPKIGRRPAQLECTGCSDYISERTLPATPRADSLDLLNDFAVEHKIAIQTFQGISFIDIASKMPDGNWKGSGHKKYKDYPTPSAAARDALFLAICAALEARQ